MNKAEGLKSAEGIKTGEALFSMQGDLSGQRHGSGQGTGFAVQAVKPESENGFLDGALQSVQDPQVPSIEPGIFSGLLSVSGALVFVLALFYALTYLVRRLGLRQGWMAPQAKSLIRVIASQRLDVRRSISVVEIKDKILILGLGAQEISVLDVVDDPKKVQALREEVEKESLPEAFQKSLSAAFDKKERSDQVQTGRDSILKARGILDKVMNRIRPGDKQ